ncbi:hypothetical protein TNIN_415221 [Trichonephila inaurata madagascariensis]|uniref:Uncharacterized protein n=1 Tax=Trichonephila inaurata madagascariensis TaxID=2747483 RepID=A0A8X6J7C2_9ARAC|nr:hypothetical protein TNIN_490681 [Trichonephila inaurata madagascariensis]GFY43497.1 hypothetical protein TNIN_415221 [Trichonephila inaurata madagascariensis]
MYLTDNALVNELDVTLVEVGRGNRANRIFFSGISAGLFGVSSPMLDSMSLSEELSEKHGFNLSIETLTFLPLMKSVKTLSDRLITL